MQPQGPLERKPAQAVSVRAQAEPVFDEKGASVSAAPNAGNAMPMAAHFTIGSVAIKVGRLPQRSCLSLESVATLSPRANPLRQEGILSCQRQVLPVTVEGVGERYHWKKGYSRERNKL